MTNTVCTHWAPSLYLEPLDSAINIPTNVYLCGHCRQFVEVHFQLNTTNVSPSKFHPKKWRHKGIVVDKITTFHLSEMIPPEEEEETNEDEEEELKWLDDKLEPSESFDEEPPDDDFPTDMNDEVDDIWHLGMPLPSA